MAVCAVAGHLVRPASLRDHVVDATDDHRRPARCRSFQTRRPRRRCHRRQLAHRWQHPLRWTASKRPRPASSARAKAARGAAARPPKDALAALVRNRRVACDVLDDSTPATRARCFVGGNDVAEELIKKGSVFSSGGFLSRYSGIEGEAQEQKVGLWAGEAARPQDYRDKRWEEAKKSAPDGCPIKGRVRSGSRTYVLPWAPGYDGIKLKTSRGERWFCSESEAENAGWSRECF